MYNIKKIKQLLCDYYGINEKDIDSEDRTRTLARIRYIGFKMCRELTDASLHDIGQCMGKRNHATVLYGMKVINQLYNSENLLRKQYRELLNCYYDLDFPPNEKYMTVEYDGYKVIYHNSQRILK